MPVSDSFITTCRVAVSALAELTAFRAALASHDSADGGARRTAWSAAYDDSHAIKSPAYRLKTAIRETVKAQADIAGNMSDLDRESAYRTLSAQFVPANTSPPTRREEEDQLRRILLEDRFS